MTTPQSNARRGLVVAQRQDVRPELALDHFQFVQALDQGAAEALVLHAKYVERRPVVRRPQHVDAVRAVGPVREPRRLVVGQPPAFAAKRLRPRREPSERLRVVLVHGPLAPRELVELLPDGREAFAKVLVRVQVLGERLARVEFDAPHPRFPVEPVALVKRAVRAEDEPLRERAGVVRVLFDYPRQRHVGRVARADPRRRSVLRGCSGRSCCDDPHDRNDRGGEIPTRYHWLALGSAFFVAVLFFCQLFYDCCVFYQCCCVSRRE